MAPVGRPMTLRVMDPVESVRAMVAVTWPIDPPCGTVTFEVESESERESVTGAVAPPETPEPQPASTSVKADTQTKGKMPQRRVTVFWPQRCSFLARMSLLLLLYELPRNYSQPLRLWEPKKSVCSDLSIWLASPHFSLKN